VFEKPITDESTNEAQLYRKYYESFDDFLITTINNETPKDKDSWKIVLNFLPTDVGGCQ
jgi:hypothetical protein